jgi:hypothetical protein
MCTSSIVSRHIHQPLLLHNVSKSSYELRGAHEIRRGWCVSSIGDTVSLLLCFVTLLTRPWHESTDRQITLTSPRLAIHASFQDIYMLDVTSFTSKPMLREDGGNCAASLFFRVKPATYRFRTLCQYYYTVDFLNFFLDRNIWTMQSKSLKHLEFFTAYPWNCMWSPSDLKIEHDLDLNDQ